MAAALKQAGVTEVITADGKTVPVDSLAGKVVGFYFSAHWCGPCRAFTPQLGQWFRRFREQHARKDELELVFVSSDRNDASFEEYHGEMPFAAVPFDEQDGIARLNARYGVRGIPALCFVEADGSLITDQGRQVVAQDPDARGFPWRPAPAHPQPEGPQLLAPQARVQIHGLKSAAQHNGKAGTVVGYDAEAARYIVGGPDGLLLKLKPANLIQLAPVEVCGLAGRPELNGATGTIGSYNAETQRFVVSLDGKGGDAVALKAANLLFRAGVRVCLHGLSAEAFNGQWGTVTGMDREAGRYVVQLAGADTKKFKPGNCRILAPAEPS